VPEIFPKLALKNKSIANQVWARGKLQIRNLGLPASARLWQAGVSLLFFPRILINDNPFKFKKIRV
jgi:hypothetical protein